PSALAISQVKNLKGKEFIEGVICGYQTAIIIGKIANPYHRNQGFHSSGTIGSFASAATSSKLLKLSKEEIINSLGLSGTVSGGLLESDHKGTMGKVFHIGNGIYNGILSTYLAKNGFTSTETILEGKEGFLNSMAKITPNEELTIYSKEKLKEDLKKFHINECYLKRYPVCRHLHSSVDSTITINGEISNTNINSDYIKEISIETYPIAAEHNNYTPKNKEELKQSLPFTVASILILKELNIDNINQIFKDKALYEKIKNLAEKIKIIEKPEFSNMFPEKRPSDVTINFENIGKISKITNNPIGESENPLKKKDNLNKFKSLNPNFDVNNLKEIKNIENVYINEFMKVF
ncbi:MAG: MmgE/PrpD family protein, partial [Methanobrevibacter sp.]|nr:MmgE/PrpD family protein [Methanobrevibacter sp.]